MGSYKTRSKHDRSITRSLQRWAFDDTLDITAHAFFFITYSLKAPNVAFPTHTMQTLLPKTPNSNYTTPAADRRKSLRNAWKFAKEQFRLPTGKRRHKPTLLSPEKRQPHIEQHRNARHLLLSADLTLNIPSTASSERALAPRPYTVSARTRQGAREP